MWTLSQNCFFLYRQGVDEFFETQDLLFEVRDWDAIGKDTTLGTVTISKQDLMKGDGERMEYKLILNSEFTAENDEPVSLCIKDTATNFHPTISHSPMKPPDSSCNPISSGYTTRH